MIPRLSSLPEGKSSLTREEPRTRPAVRLGVWTASRRRPASGDGSQSPASRPAPYNQRRWDSAAHHETNPSAERTWAVLSEGTRTRQEEEQ